MVGIGTVCEVIALAARSVTVQIKFGQCGRLRGFESSGIYSDQLTTVSLSFQVMSFTVSTQNS